MANKLPISITPCPIFDCSVDLKFSTDIPAEAVFGIIYGQLSEYFPNASRLPVADLPLQLRQSDETLKFSPHYRIDNGKTVVQIGPNVITIGFIGAYPGWISFSKDISNILNKIDLNKLIKKLEIVGLRYINFLENINAYDKINFELKINDEVQALNESTYFKTITFRDDYRLLLQLSNKSEIEGKLGSIIDIDTQKKGDVDEIEDIIASLHTIGKEKFFSLLESDYLNTLSPKY